MKFTSLLILLFITTNSFAQLNYNDMNNWAFHPNKPGTLIDGFNIDIAVIDENLNTTSIIHNTNNSMINTGVDVFFIHPTILENIASYNTVANVPVADQNSNMIAASIRGQVGLLAKYGRFFAPRYSQATPPTFISSPTDTNQANVIGVAYNDIKTAFLHYLNNYNNGNKIIIASHSQGAYLTGILLRDVFDNNPQLLEKLVVAVTAGISSNYSDENTITGGWWQNIPFCTQQNECGCVMSWKSYKDGQIPPTPNNSHPALNPTIVNNNYVYSQLDLSQDWLYQDSLYYSNTFSSLKNFITLRSNVNFGGNVGYVAFDDMYQIKHFRYSSTQVGFTIQYTPKPNDQRPDFLFDEESNPFFSILGYHQKDYNIYTWALLTQIDMKLSSCNVLNITNEPLASNTLIVFPNPVTESFTLKFSDNQNFNGKIEIFNIMGSLVKELELPQSRQINISELTNGIYFIRFKNYPQQTLKFIKQ